MSITKSKAVYGNDIDREQSIDILWIRIIIGMYQLSVVVVAAVKEDTYFHLAYLPD